MMQNYKATVYAVESKVDMATRTLKYVPLTRIRARISYPAVIPPSRSASGRSRTL